MGKGAIPLHKTLRGAAVCFLAALVLMGGCGQQPVAVVNGQKIAKAEFMNRLKKAAGPQVLTDLILRALVEDAFARSGLQLPEQEVQERLKEVQAEFPSPEAFNEWLTSRAITLDDLQKELAFQIKLERLRSKDVKYSEADLKKFFQENRKFFDKPERVVVSQIVVSSKQEADKIYQDLQKPGANFAAMARQYSIDAMFRQFGGRLPEMPTDRLMPPEVQAVVRGMQPGRISQPIKVGESYYIVKLEARKPAEKAVFEKVRNEVERQFRLRNAKPVEALLKELADQASVQVLDPELAEVQKQFLPKTKLPTFGGEGPGQEQRQGQQQPSGATPAPSGTPSGQTDTR